MIIREIKYRPFHRSLKSKFSSASNQITERKGFFISVQDQYGNSGIGEISPLLGFSSESLIDAENDIKFLNKSISGKEFSIDQYFSGDSLYSKRIVPSVSFGFEQAVLNLLISNNHVLLSNYFNLSHKEIIPVNSVIDLSGKNKILNEVTGIIDSGFRTIKLKAGRSNFDEELEILDSLREKIPDEIQIRLDVSSAWDANSTLENLQKLSPYNIQFVEDPCRDLEFLSRISKVSPIPIAPDFTIQSIEELTRLLDNDFFKFIVIKPMMLGSIVRLIKLLKRVEGRNIYFVISSAFETEVGRSMLILLSSMVKHNFAHGLATSRYFEDEEFQDPYPIVNGTIKFNPVFYPPKFKIDL